MFRSRRSVVLIVLLLSSVPGIILAAGGGTKGFPGVSLSVSNETAPPGATTQVKISVTEPKPILTGGGSLSLSTFDSVFGIAIIAPGGDTFGVALERGTNIGLSVLSPSSNFGMNIDYPILTIAGRVPATAPIGAKFVLPIDAAAFHFLDSSGTAYPLETNPGQLTIGNGVAIGNVSPGSAVVQAGDVVTISGTNFVPNTTIVFKEAKLSQVRFVSATRIDVVPAQTVTMHGTTVIAKNPDGSQATYFSYERTHAMSASADPVMQFAVPLFPPKTAMTALIPLPAPKTGFTYGVALQNIDAAGAFAMMELVDGDGNALAVTAANLDPSTFLVRELSELFGPTPPNARAVRVTSSAPIQVMGIAADQNAGTADPIVESATVPKTPATVTFDAGTLSQIYDGSVKSVSTTTSPLGLPVTVAFTGTPRNAGSYPVTATINDPNYAGSATGTLTIARAGAAVTFDAATLSQTYDGSVKTVSATTSPAGLAVDVVVTGTPQNAGSYPVTATINDPNYAGSATGTLTIARAKPAVLWNNPAGIVYGTPLSATQLNASSNVAGTFVYTPAAGAILDAGTQTLQAVFTPADAANFEPVTATLTLAVARAPLSLRVDDQTKRYGSPLPILTGTLTGVVNGDDITPLYATVATIDSAVGFYPITGALSDRNGRLPNYDVTITSATLAVTKTPLLVKANDASKQYSDALPAFTASFSGFVLGETPAVLGGALLLQTTATNASGPGIYPIAASGLTSPNYDVVFGAGTLTVTPEDASVFFIAPLSSSVSPASGKATVTLAATVQELQGPDESADTLGDIRNATLTFVDRGTGQTLCIAPIGLVSSSRLSVGVASCTFNAPAGSYTVESRVGGWYARDAQADDVVITIVTATQDSVKGNGRATLTAPVGADPNSRLDLDVTAAYDKSVLSGNVTLTFVRTVDGILHTYEIDAAPMASLVIHSAAAGGIASITGTATLTDVTAKHAPIVIDDHAALLATFTDSGDSKIDDTIAVTLIGKNGGLLFSSKWSGTHTEEEAVFDGNIKVHFDK